MSTFECKYGGFLPCFECGKGGDCRSEQYQKKLKNKNLVYIPSDPKRPSLLTLLVRQSKEELTKKRNPSFLIEPDEPKGIYSTTINSSKSTNYNNKHQILYQGYNKEERIQELQEIRKLTNLSPEKRKNLPITIDSPLSQTHQSKWHSHHAIIAETDSESESEEPWKTEFMYQTKIKYKSSKSNDSDNDNDYIIKSNKKRKKRNKYIIRDSDDSDVDIKHPQNKKQKLK